MSGNEISTPRAFISYAWSSEAHRDWVRLLAERLVANGVDVVLDQWDLRPGHEATKFMEQMVSDLSVSKVIIICDRAYAEKAAARVGGVGTEAQIISPEIYAQTPNQERFVVVSRELDEEGRPCRPVFYTSRIFIPMIDDQAFESHYETLLRWAYDRPIHQKPQLGDAPISLLEAAPTTRAAASAADARIRGLKDSGSSPTTATTFLDLALEELKQYVSLNGTDAAALDEQVWANAENMLPLTNRVCEVFYSELVAGLAPKNVTSYIRFLERCEDLTSSHEGWPSHTRWSLDHHKIFVRDLFVRLVAIALRGEQFTAANMFLMQRYSTHKSRNRDGPRTASYSIFSQAPQSLAARNERLGLRRMSLYADLLKQRCAAGPVSFEDYMQADFALYLDRVFVNNSYLTNDRWIPYSLIYAMNYHGPFTLFVRSESRQYADQFAKAFNFANGETLKLHLERVISDPKNLPSWDYEQLDAADLSNLKNLLQFA